LQFRKPFYFSLESGAESGKRREVWVERSGIVLSYLVSIRLKNIQTWVDTTVELDRGLTVLQGPNNSGKTVPFKVFKKMCVNIAGGRKSKRGLIRTGAEFGEAWLNYEDFTVKFEIYKTYQVYRLLNLEGEVLESWEQNTLPEKLKKLMGWYVDEEYRIVLNLTGQGNSKPFSDTNPQFNARVLKFLTENPELETAKINLKYWVNDLDVARIAEESNVRSLTSLSNNYSYKDLESFRNNIAKKKMVLICSKFLMGLGESLETIRDLSLGEAREIDKNLVQGLLECKENLVGIKGILAESEKLIAPQFKLAEKDEIAKALQAKEELQDMLDGLRDFSKTQTAFLEEDLTLLDKEKMEKAIKVYTIIMSVKRLLAENFNISQNKRKTERDLERIQEKLISLRQELRICPLCGKEFDGVLEGDCCGK
jgi:hypothetical protein